jgi:hypothetical protein
MDEPRSRIDQPGYDRVAADFTQHKPLSKGDRKFLEASLGGLRS